MNRIIRRIKQGNTDIKISTTKSTKILKGKPSEFSELSYLLIGCAMEVHRALGSGLLESTYQRCLAHEFESNFSVQRLEDGLKRYAL